MKLFGWEIHVRHSSGSKERTRSADFAHSLRKIGPRVFSVFGFGWLATVLMELGLLQVMTFGVQHSVEGMFIGATLFTVLALAFHKLKELAPFVTGMTAALLVIGLNSSGQQIGRDEAIVIGAVALAGTCTSLFDQLVFESRSRRRLPDHLRTRLDSAASSTVADREVPLEQQRETT